LELRNQKLQVVKQQNYEQAAELRDKEKKLLDRLEKEKIKFEEEQAKNKKVIEPELVLTVVSSMTKIPVNKLSVDDKNSLVGLEKTLQQEVIGQNEAVSKIARAIRRNRLGIKDPNKPIGSFVFLGSTGVGKTHLAKQLAKQIFGSSDSLIRVDMSEYQEKHTISRLIGSPPGYVGYEEGGQLTEQVKNKPYSVVLFDEVEKANKEIFHTLLQMLDEGHLTDSLGRKINFKNTLIIMTSNIGVKKLQDFGTGIGFGGSSYSNEEQKKEILKKEMKNYFSPEFLNRIDETIIFNSLDKESLDKIVKIELQKLMNRLKELKMSFVFDDTLVNYISKVGFDAVYGARPIKRAIQDEVEDLISELVLNGDVVEDHEYSITVEEDKVIVK
jgi:ATP-dependent Clp protease ATP-binding subunit ClpC